MKLITIVMLALLPSLALADGGSGARKIRTIHVEGGDFIIAYADTPFENPDGCGNSNGVILPMGSGGYKDKLTVVSLALASDLDVGFWLVGCANTTWGFTLPVVYAVSISK